MHKDNCVIVENITEVIRTESKNQEVLRQKLIALPFPQKIRWKIRIFHTHGKCYLAKEHPWFSCPPKCPMHGVTRRITNAAKLITLKQEVPDNSWTCAMWYTPMIFHSNPSSNILKTTLVAGCFSSRKKRQTQPQVKDCFQSLFFPSGKDKSWCNGPVGATWHSSEGHLDHSHDQHGNTWCTGSMFVPSPCRLKTHSITTDYFSNPSINT